MFFYGRYSYNAISLCISIIAGIRGYYGKSNLYDVWVILFTVRNPYSLQRYRF